MRRGSTTSTWQVQHHGRWRARTRSGTTTDRLCTLRLPLRAALKSLRQALRAPPTPPAAAGAQPGGSALLAALCRSSASPTGLQELLGVWDAQLKGPRHTPVLVELLLLLADVLQHLRGALLPHHKPPSPGAVPSAPGGASGDAAAGSALLGGMAEALSRHVVGSRMRPLYHALSSDSAPLQRAALALLGALAALSPEAGRDLLGALDTGLAALGTLAKPPRRVGSSRRRTPGVG